MIQVYLNRFVIQETDVKSFNLDFLKKGTFIFVLPQVHNQTLFYTF